MTDAWQSIASAPVPADEWSDSAVFLVWNGVEVLPCKIWRNTDDHGFDDISCCDRDGEYGEVSPPPIYWQPLPAPPTDRSKP